jgi:hypothetical protein
MGEKNQFGLDRYIPTDVRLEVRKSCGFGCVVCGASIVEYEHVDPEFKNAHSHDPSTIALLCSRCHGYVTRKFWSKEKIKAALADPHSKRAGFSWGELDLGPEPPSIQFAGVLLTRCHIPLEVCGRPLFQTHAPESPGGPFRLSAVFTNADGTPALEIVENDWKLSSSAWDVELSGGRIVIRNASGGYSLILKLDPPHGVIVEELRMALGDYYFEGSAHELKVYQRQEGKAFCIGSFKNSIMDGNRVGMSFG